MAIDASDVKKLRDMTGVGMMDARSALEETKGDLDRAALLLRKKGQATAAKKAERAASEGLVESYIHPGSRVGVLVEVNCETDFVARTDDFKNFVKEIAMHIAAANPLYVNDSDVPEELIEKEKEIYKEQMRDAKKPDDVIEKILSGKIDKFLSEIVLLRQPWIKDDKMTIGDLATDQVAKLGENIVIRRFSRFSLGE